MNTEPQKNNSILIIVAIIGVIGTITASIIGVIGNYNTEKFRQEAALTQMALVSIATQGGATQIVMQNTIDAPPPATYTPLPTYTLFPTPSPTVTMSTSRISY